jgi:hypothetical protein
MCMIGFNGKKSHAFRYLHPPRSLFRHFAISYLHIVFSCLLYSFQALPRARPVVIPLAHSSSLAYTLKQSGKYLQTCRHRVTNTSTSRASYSVISASYSRCAFPVRANTLTRFHIRYWYIYLFIYLYNEVIIYSEHTALNYKAINKLWTGSKQSWANLCYCTGICLKVLKKIIKYNKICVLRHRPEHGSSQKRSRMPATAPRNGPLPPNWYVAR